jgi:uncharacterized protein DUF4389
MTTNPVQFRAETPPHREPVHVAMRLVLLVALGLIGCSSAYWFLYLALPATAALLITQHGARQFITSDARRIVRVFRWVAAAYAYLWLLTDALPGSEGAEAIELDVEPDGNPTTASALLRLLYSIPAMLLLALLSVVGVVLWVIGAAGIVAWRRLPDWISDYMALTLRYQFRLLAYHLSLVDRYPTVHEEGATRDATS